MDRQIVRDVVASIAVNHPRPVVDDDRLVEDLALDSMAKLELAAALEVRLDRPVTDAIVMKARTVADLADALAA